MEEINMPKNDSKEDIENPIKSDEAEDDMKSKNNKVPHSEVAVRKLLKTKNRKIIIKRRKIKIYMNIEDKTMKRLRPIYKSHCMLKIRYHHCGQAKEFPIEFINMFPKGAIGKLGIYDKAISCENQSNGAANEALIYDITNSQQSKLQLTLSSRSGCRSSINKSNRSNDSKKRDLEMPDLGSLSLSDTSATNINNTCSQEARQQEDISIDDLSGYLDNILHFPKKMSVMAETMYT